MENILLMIYPVIILLVAFFGAKVSFRGEFAPDFLCRQQSRRIQAICCLVVIVHHVTQQITRYGTLPKGPVTIFSDIGFLFTAVFFFFSGYGLMISLDTKEDYLKGFLARRLTAVLIPFWIINIIGVIITAVVSGASTFFHQYSLNFSGGILNILKYIPGISLINSNGWFIIEIVILYLLFYALFSIIKNRNVALFLMCAAVVVLIVFSFFQGHDEGSKSHWFRGEWWYNSTITFAFGMIAARFRGSIEVFFKRHYAALMALSALLTGALVYATRVVLDSFGYYNEHLPTYRTDAAITLVVQSLTCIIWVLFLVLLNMKITITSRAMGFIGGIQLPLFLIHGYFANTIFGNIEMKDFVRYGVVFATSIPAAWLVSIPVDAAVRVLTGVLLREKKRNDTLEARAAEALRQKRSRMVRGFLAAGIVVAFVAMIAAKVGSRLYLEGECKKEMEVIGRVRIGDTVVFGRFDTNPSRLGREKLQWIVAGREGDRICLLTKEGIAGSYYNQKHREVTWADCDLRALLGTELFTGIFSECEMEYVLPQGQDILTLLTVAQAREMFGSDSERELAITDAAEKYGTNINRPSKANNWDMKDYRSSWWWLKGSGAPSATAPIVTVDGEILTDVQEVNRPGGAIRPVVYVKVEH